MKAIKLFVFSLIAFSFSGCDDELFDIKFNMPSIEVKYTLEPKDTAGIIVLTPSVQTINLDSLALANGTDLSKLKSCKVTKITIMIESPATANFDALDGGFLNASIGITGDPDFDLLRIAEIKDVPKGVTQIDVTPTDVDLLKFAKKTHFTISGELRTNKPIVEKMNLKCIIETEVVANPVSK